MNSHILRRVYGDRYVFASYCTGLTLDTDGADFYPLCSVRFAFLGLVDFVEETEMCDSYMCPSEYVLIHAADKVECYEGTCDVEQCCDMIRECA